MRVLLAGATGAIGRPLIRSLKQHGHSAFGLVRSVGSTRMLIEMGAEAVILALPFRRHLWPDSNRTLGAVASARPISRRRFSP